MAITPISNALTRNYNVGFTGKNKKSENVHPNSSNKAMTFVKAAPLAAVIAMSPLTTQNIQSAEKLPKSHNIEFVENHSTDDALQNSTIISHKEFEDATELGLNADVYLTKNPKGSKNANSVEVAVTSMDDRLYDQKGLQGIVKGLINLTYEIFGDDGNEYGKLKLRQFLVEDKNNPGDFYNVTSSKVSDYLESIVKDPKYDTGIETLNLTRKIRPTVSTGLQNVPTDPSWMEKAKKVSQDFGKEVVTAEVQGTFGKYQLVGYSTDGDDSNFEVLTIGKLGTYEGIPAMIGPEMKVDAIREVNTQFYNYDIFDQVTYNQINISKDGVGHFVIMDDELAAALRSATGAPQFNKAYELKSDIENVLVLPSGTVAKMDYQEGLTK